MKRCRFWRVAGSAMLPDDTTRHTGRGRVSRLPSAADVAFRVGHSTRVMSPGAMLRGEPVLAKHSRTIVMDLVEPVFRGGWPRMAGAATGDSPPVRPRDRNVRGSG